MSNTKRRVDAEWVVL